MREHLHNITLRHWDEAMRTLAAVALKDLLRLGDNDDIDDAVEREVSYMYLVIRAEQANIARSNSSPRWMRTTYTAVCPL
jgi:hypothetical protein